MVVYVQPTASEPLLTARAIRAAADVVDVEAGGGFCASVMVVPGAVAVARLDRSLRGAAHEGQVLYEVMCSTTGADGPGLHLWTLSPDGTLHRW